jgi:urease accessory protein
MLRANRVQSGAIVNVETIDTITLDHQARHRRRMAMTSDGGLRFLLDLPDAVQLQHGDGLVLEDGRIVLIKAAPEALLEIRARDSRHLTALAWQIGNRHLEAQIEEDRILIRRDHVIEAMLIGLGAATRDVVEIFKPEAGAYGGHNPHGH